jgi:hypothetical protein
MYELLRISSALQVRKLTQCRANPHCSPIPGAIERKREPRRTCDSEPPVKIKTTWTLLKEVNFRTAELQSTKSLISFLIRQNAIRCHVPI